jgi:nucleotide-binding universal stress UspA family protein
MNPILVPVDGSDCSRRALEVASSLAAKLDAAIVVFHALDLGRAAAMSGGEPQLVAGILEELRSESQRILSDAVKQVDGQVAISSRAGEGAPVEEIERVADEISPSFVAIGSHGRTGLERLMMGSVAEGVVRAAPVPVMVVPCGRRARTPGTG